MEQKIIEIDGELSDTFLQLSLIVRKAELYCKKGMDLYKRNLEDPELYSMAKEYLSIKKKIKDIESEFVRMLEKQIDTEAGFIYEINFEKSTEKHLYVTKEPTLPTEEFNVFKKLKEYFE